MKKTRHATITFNRTYGYLQSSGYYAYYVCIECRPTRCSICKFRRASIHTETLQIAKLFVIVSKYPINFDQQCMWSYRALLHGTRVTYRTSNVTISIISNTWKVTYINKVTPVLTCSIDVCLHGV